MAKYRIMVPAPVDGTAGRIPGGRTMRPMKRTLLALALGVGLASAAAPLDPAHAEAITRVRGSVKDASGKPMPKVKIFFEAVDIKRRVGPLTTNKDGVFMIATLDVSVAKKWRVIPEMP